METLMTDKPHLVIDWHGATEANKQKALAAINEGFKAIGSTEVEGAYSQFNREGDELAYMMVVDAKDAQLSATSINHEAADLWISVEETACAALGRDKLPQFDYWIEPWATQAKMEKD